MGLTTIAMVKSTKAPKLETMMAMGSMKHREIVMTLTQLSTLVRLTPGMTVSIQTVMVTMTLIKMAMGKNLPTTMD